VTDVEELGATLAALRDAFEALGVVWAVGGSLASAAHGEPRATNDVDVVAALDRDAALALPRLLPDFYCDPDTVLEATQNRDAFNLIDQRSFLKVDVFVPAAGPIGVGQLRRRRELTLPGGIVVPVLSPEDIVLQKLRWFELLGRASDRQWRDVVEVLRAGDLDDAYLDEVARGAGLAEPLADARRDAALGT